MRIQRNNRAGSEQCQKRVMASRRELDDARILVAPRPLQVVEPGQQRGAQGSRQMVSALAPVHAGPAEGAALPGGGVRINA
jgi:hypothetical protein